MSLRCVEMSRGPFRPIASDQRGKEKRETRRHFCHGDTRITGIAMTFTVVGVDDKGSKSHLLRHSLRPNIFIISSLSVFTAAHKNSIKHCSPPRGRSELLSLRVSRHKKRSNSCKIGECAALDDGLAVVTSASSTRFSNTTQLSLIDSLPAAVVEDQFVDCRRFYIALLNIHRSEIQRALIKGAINFTRPLMKSLRPDKCGIYDFPERKLLLEPRCGVNIYLSNARLRGGK